MTYIPPVTDMIFALRHVLDFESEAADAQMMTAILEEAGKLAAVVLAPLNQSGDRTGAAFDNGAVTCAPGFKAAYAAYRDGGWNALPFPEDYGGQGLPWAMAFPIQEMWQAANMSFGLCPLLNQGAVEALLSHGTAEQKAYYLPKLVTGEWTGTMNLTEPQAGSDLGLLRARAEPDGQGGYKVFGQKIYITYGEHDLAENIIHLVLARLLDAPEDVKGISLFLVPKFLEDGARNDVACTGIEHKLGIHASPTCTMQFGDNGGAAGYLIGEAHQGLKYMFTMMNNARLSVGLQGVAIADRATQAAYQYATGRIQGKSIKTGERVSIDRHPDVERMLLQMQSVTEAGRLLTYSAAMALDAAQAGDAQAQARADLLTPLVKAWCTDMACEVASLGIQVHGGMGYVEETGAAQYLRDARILPIYEGTNGIQAADFMFRKVARDKGAAALSYLEDLEAAIRPQDQGRFEPVFEQARGVLAWVNEKAGSEEADSLAGAASDVLNGFALTAAAALMSRAAAAAVDYDDQAFAEQKIRNASFFMARALPLAQARFTMAVRG